MITCLALSPSLDVTYVVETLERGGIARPVSAHKVAGGKGLNVARVAARLGASVRAIAVLGGHTGEHVAGLLEGSGVDLDVVPVAGETRTCVSIAPVDDDRMTEVYEASPTVDDAAWASVRDRLARVLAGEWLVVSGSLPPGIRPAQIADALRELGDAGVRVAVDTHGEALDAILGSAPTVVKVNRSEAAGALGVDATASAADLACALRERTGGIVIVTDGVDGSTAATPDGVIRIPPDSVRGRYPVGSGDSYTAGVVVALARGEDVAAAALLGAACASANAAVPGAAVWSLGALDEVLDRLAAPERRDGSISPTNSDIITQRNV